MKNILYILFIIGSLQGLMAQEELERADTYFEREFYSDAIPLYEQLLPKHKSAKLVRNLADSYYNTFNMNAAARWYGYLINNYGTTSEAEDPNSLSQSFKSFGEGQKIHIGEAYYEKYSHSLLAIGKYERAQRTLLDFYTARGDSAKVEQLKRQFTYLNNVRAIGNRFSIENLALNTVTSEFGAAKVDSSLIYSASRKTSQVLPKVYRWNNQAYLDLYAHPIAKLDLGDSLSTSLSKNVNSKMHEGTFAITKNRKTLYFTRNSKQKTDEKVSNLKIYRAEKVNGEWKNITALPFNSDDFSTEHPALSPDETNLYFASDREGGFGSFDLYSVTIGKDGFYGNPTNLGEKINTDKKEQFPFLDSNGNLYFASNGHPGLGLLDVFIVKGQGTKHGGPENGSGFGKPDNLGLPINSGYDDFSIWLDADGKTGYFSSNRPAGKGSDDIYSFSETKPLIIENCKQFIAGIVTDKTTKQPLANTQLKLLDAKGKVIESLTTGRDASFKFTVECARPYRLEARKKVYESNIKLVQTTEERKATQDGSLTLYSIQEREAQKAIVLQKKKEEAEKLALAEDRRIAEQEKAAEHKRIQLEKEMAEKEKLAAEKAKKEHLRKVQDAIEKEEALVRDKERTVIKTPEIHFDYSLWYLRRESRERLGPVIEIMKANPGIVLEIGTHTDIRGNEEYNRDLSQKRADAVKDFLVENGIADNRVIAKGYGESQPIVHCETEESCSEEDHEWNRRCELVVVEWKAPDSEASSSK
ncbi:MAG: OmpA family protein [Pricia sp.]